MKPDEDIPQPRRLGYSATLPVRGPLGTALALVTGAALLVLGFTFSLLILAAAAVAGSLGFGYLWWKTRALRKQIREQMDYQAQQHRMGVPPMEGGSPGGEIIEGEVLREERETRG